MFEVQTFTGTPEELSLFVCGTWRGDYAGRMAFPLWSPDYLDWQLDLSNSHRSHVIAAYDNGQLIGAILGMAVPFRLPGQGVVDGIISSWLSVDAAYRRIGVVRELKAIQEARARAAGMRLILAYRYLGSPASLSKPPTMKDMQSGEWSTRRVGFWVRVIDPRRSIAWSVDRMSRLVTRLGTPFVKTSRHRPGRMTIRPIESGDLPSAVELLSTHEPQRPFGIHWSEPVLARHCLGSRVGQCWVAVDEGRVRGLVSFHVLPFLARSIELVGILDIVAIDRLSWSEQTRLLDSVLATIQEQGAVLAMTIRTGDAPGWAMLRSGFIPWVRDSILTVRRLDDGPPFSLADRPNLLWR